jgi:hypothetical protein
MIGGSSSFSVVLMRGLRIRKAKMKKVVNLMIPRTILRIAGICLVNRSRRYNQIERSAEPTKQIRRVHEGYSRINSNGFKVYMSIPPSTLTTCPVI